MDIFDGVKAVARRWYVLVPVLALTAYLAYATYSDVTPVYSSSLIVGVTTDSVTTEAPVPAGSPTINSSNALIGSGGTALISNLLLIGLRQPEVVDEVVAAGGTAGYDVVVYQRPQSQGQLPIVTVTATDEASAKVVRTLQVLRQAADATLTNVQSTAGVPTDRMAKAYVVQPATDPVRSTPSAVRSTATVAIIGALVAIALAGVTDAIVVRRGRSVRSAPAHAVSESDVAPRDDDAYVA